MYFYFLVFKIFDKAENSSVEIPDYIYKFILSREQDFKRHSLTVLTTIMHTLAMEQFSNRFLTNSRATEL
jgi:hypothetical protein